MARPDAFYGNRPFFDLDAFRLGLVFRQAQDHEGVEGRARNFLGALRR